MAKTVFDDMKMVADDAFWAATGAQTESNHTGDESLDNLPNVFGKIVPVRPDVETQPAAKQTALGHTAGNANG